MLKGLKKFFIKFFPLRLTILTGKDEHKFILNSE